MLRRVWLSVLLVVVAAIVWARPASAGTAVGRETRVSIFELTPPTLVGASCARSAEKRRANAIAYDGMASGPRLRWKGRWRMYAAGVGTAAAVELYDMRARWWAPQLGVFLSVDDFAYSDISMTLWAWPGQNPYRWSDPTGHDFWSAAGSFGEGVAWGIGGSVVVAGLIATGTVAGTVVAVGLVGYGAFQLGATITEAALGHDMFGNPISKSDRVDMAAGAAGGLIGGAIGGWGYGAGKEITIPFKSCRGTNGKPPRVAPWGNRTGNKWGEYPHFHRAIPDPAKPGESLPGQNLKKHRPWEGGWGL